MSDGLAFNQYTTPDGKLVFGCRGTGDRYQEFYKWVDSTSYYCVHDDFPWDYFIFTEEADEQEFLKRYTNDIWDNGFQLWEGPITRPEASPAEILLAEILKEEMQKEIDLDILSEILAKLNLPEK